ncbi:integrase catalytic domain-containing protein [Trichonephila clavipes]|nr:integrase catalytic domain-containing protein [Trichonephila clavipes]
MLIVSPRPSLIIFQDRKPLKGEKNSEKYHLNAKKCDVTPGILPKDRVRDAATFQIVGVDLAGPLYLKHGPKAYIVLYTCAVYRAIHLEAILRKILGRAALDYEELITILCDCERVINSRPLTYVSEDVDDVSPLTPEMFLREIPESEVPDIDTVDREKLSKSVTNLYGTLSLTF